MKIKSLKETVAGDIILSANDSWLSKAIRMFEAWQTGAADRSHAALVIGDYQCYEPLTEDKINWLEKYEGKDIEVWRIPLKPNERTKLSINTRVHAGTNYGYTKIALFALDAVASVTRRTFTFGKINKPVTYFSKNIGFLPTHVCSTGIMKRIYENTKYRIRDEDHNEVPPEVLSPDRIQDLLLHPHNNAQLIFKGDTSPS